MSYEITYPEARAMIDAERAERLLPLDAYQHGTVAATVARSIRSAEWLAGGGQRAVDLVLAALEAITNVDDYALCVLRHAAEQVRARGVPSGPLRLYGWEFNRPYWRPAPTLMALQVDRKDGGPLEWRGV